jgi:threonine dehydrogenase-like Zn-dependent dehydrogenase
VKVLAKAGTLGIIGVYPSTMKTFPVGDTIEKNLTIRVGNCNHRKYLPALVRLVRSGVVDPAKILTQRAPITSAIEAYRAFDERRDGWVKVELLPATRAA